MQLSKALIFLIIIATLPTASAVGCDPPVKNVTINPYPGWNRIYNQEVTVGTLIEGGYNGTPGMGDLSVKVLEIFDNALVNVEIIKKGVYKEGPVTIIKSADHSDRVEFRDIRFLAPFVGINTANLTIYTLDQSILNITSNITYESFTNYTFPGEEFELDIELKNIGGLGADAITMEKEFGDFEIITSEGLPASSLCPTSTFDMKYIIKTPTGIKEDSNYTLYVTLNYNDYNPELYVSKTHTDRIPLDIVVKTLSVNLSKTSGSWSITNPARELRVENTIENAGTTTAFNLELQDTPPPDLEVVSGTTSKTLSRLEPGKKKEYSYSVVSNDPISCVTMSKLAYKDEFGNQYTTISGRTNLTFSPALRITKTFTDRPSDALAFEYPFKTKSTPTSTDLNETEIILVPDISDNNVSWTEYGDTNIRIKRTGADVTLMVENIGNAIASGLSVYEDLSGVNYAGNTSWQGALQPGDTITYGYAVMPIAHENISITTKTSYQDVDRASLDIDESITGYFPGACTKTLINITKDLSREFTLAVASINVSQNSSISVYEDSRFDFTPTIKNNGTDRAYDLEISIDVGNFTITKGQTKTYYDSLDAGGEIPQNLVLWSPSVENTTSFPIKTRVKYKDFYNEEFEVNTTTMVTVYPALEAFIIVRVERTQLSTTINYADESDINEPSKMEIRLKNQGFAAIENLTFNLSLPKNMEISTNDTVWTGRVEAEIKRPTDILYIFTDDISWSGNLSKDQEKTLDLTLSGSKSGHYKIPYTVTYDGKQISEVLDFKVKGAIITMTKTIEKSEVNMGEEINILVIIENIGEANATNVFIEDEAPSGVDVIGETRKNMTIFEPGQVLTLSYQIKSDKSGDYTLGKAKVNWEDILGNMYSEESKIISLKVKEGEKPPETTPTPTTTTPAPTMTSPPTITPYPTPTTFPNISAFGPGGKKIELTQKEVIVTIIFTLIVFGILFRVLILTRPVEEE